jgi:hypothetical protein
MPQFQLTDFLPVTMGSLSLPARKKGTEIVHTTDIAFDFEGSNKLLDLFDAALLPMIYRAAIDENEVEQHELEGVETVSDLPMLRSVSIKMPIPLALEYAGYTMIIDRGLGEQRKDSNIQVDEITIKRIRVWCKEGGSIKGSMHLQSKNVSDVQVGQLRSFLKLQTQLKLLAPQVKQAPIDGTAEAFYKERLASGDPLAADLAPASAPAKPTAAKPAAKPKPTAAAKPPEKKLTVAQRQAKAREDATAAFAGDGTRMEH